MSGGVFRCFKTRFLRGLTTRAGGVQNLSTTLLEMLYKLLLCALLLLPSITAAVLHERLARTLIRTKKKNLEQTFKALEKAHEEDDVTCALVSVAVQNHVSTAVDCIRMIDDPFPRYKSYVNSFVNSIIAEISRNIPDAELFAKVITSFKPSDIKPLASIRYWTIGRKDVVDVLKSVMTRSTLIINDLANWLTSHHFDQISATYNKVSREEALDYLASFATQSVLEEALSIVKKEHYVIVVVKTPAVVCCETVEYVPQNLYDKISTLLEHLKIRKAYIKLELLPHLPSVLVDMVLEHIQVAQPDDYISTIMAIVQTQCIIS